MINPEELTKQFNHNMVDLLLQGGQIRTPTIEKAFREVLRHKFLPTDINVVDIYQDKTIILKEANTEAPLPSGMPLSSSTMPGLLASILEAAEFRPGMRAMQIGTGPGYMAALIAHLVKESGMVVTIEVDSDIAERAREKLTSLGYKNIRCVAADGSLGYPPMAPYQRIIVTASCADVPQAWMGQLQEKGLIVLPFSLSQRASLYPMIAFEKLGDRLIGKVASSLIAVGFIPLYGEHVRYRVLYQKSTSELESATFLHLRQSIYRGAEYKAIALVALLEIAKVVDLGASGIGSIDPKKQCDQSIELWKQLNKPTVEDFCFYLLPRNHQIGDYRWHFSKHQHELFIMVLSHHD